MESIPPIQIFNTSGIEIPISESDAIFVLEQIQAHQNCEYETVELVYVDETEITRINKEYLDHDYVTDIITFRLDDGFDNATIEGTIYCCAQRITEQAAEFNQSQKDEFLRVMIHGLIHLIGYNDQTPEEKKEMTRLEDHFLSTYNNSTM
jgi:rRNA maturation RNase YbeY